MAQLCTENLFSLTIVARSAWEEEKNVSIFQFLTFYACFVGEWNDEMASQTKRDPCFERVQHLKEKLTAKTFWPK